MEKKEIGYWNNIVAPYLFGVYFLVYQSAKLFYSFNLLPAVVFICIYSALIFFCKLAMRKMFSLQHTSLSLLLLAVLILFADFFRYGIRDLFATFSVRNRYYIIGIIIVVICFVCLENIIAKRKADLYRRINRICSVFLVVLMLVAGTKGFFRMYTSRHANNESVKFSSSQNGPGIVWILMDEYPSSGSLKANFQYYNPLDKVLQEHQFILLDSIRSRSASTLFSINAIYNYDDSIKPDNFESSLLSLRNSKWVSSLESARSRFLNLDFLPIGGHEKIMSLTYFPETYNKQLLYGSLLFNAMVTYHYNDPDAYNKLAYEKLNKVLHTNADEYKLIWAHLLIPHLPYFRDSTGNTISGHEYLYNARVARNHFITYLAYGNSLIKKLLEDNPVLQNKIVIISGDHGARFSFIEKKEWKKPYCAIHLPARFDTASLYKLKYISQLPYWLNRFGVNL